MEKWKIYLKGNNRAKQITTLNLSIMKINLIILGALLFINNLLYSQNYLIKDSISIKNLTIKIAADSSTIYEGDFGYRIFLVYCKNDHQEKLIFKKMLDNDFLPNCEYGIELKKLSKDKVILINSIYKVYLYSISLNIISNCIDPIYEDCEFQDAISGKLKSIEVLKSKKILVLDYYECFSPIQYDISDLKNIKRVK